MKRRNHGQLPVSISRSFSFKLNLGNYQSMDFFSCQTTECLASEVPAKSEILHKFCKQEVMRAVHEACKEFNLPIPGQRTKGN